MKKVKNSLLSLLFWLGVWYVLALAIHTPLLLPTPLQVITRLLELMGTALFWQYTALSLLRVLAGIVLFTLLALVLSVAACSSKLLDSLLSPLLTVMKTTPVASFTILVLLWLKRDYVPVLISGMMVLPAVWSNVCTGIRETPQTLLEVGKVYRFTPGQTLRYLYFPAVLPHFRAACGSALGMAWKAGIAAEVLTVPPYSIGRMILESKQYLLTEDLFAWTLSVILLSLVLEKILLRLLKGGKRNA